MRKCVHCLQEKDEVDFSWKSKGKGLLAKECKVCHAIMRKAYYLKNKQKEIANALGSNKRKQAWYRTLKDQLQCSICGEDHPATIQFHHLKEKEFNISQAVKHGYSKKRILAEISKCQVLCANCHAKEHWRQ